MSKIELITGLPNWHWQEHCQKEIAMTGEELIEQSDVIWGIGSAAVAGFVYSSYTSPPWMWFVLAKNVTIADLIDFRRLAVRIPQGTLTAVATDFPVAMKFAKVYGFVETEHEVMYFDRLYKIMRKV